MNQKIKFNKIEKFMKELESYVFYDFKIMTMKKKKFLKKLFFIYCFQIIINFV